MAYSPTEVDNIVVALEDTAEKLLAVASSMVKRQAAEKNVLSNAERARDIMDKAVKGDKQKLETVFGGTCERIGRLRIMYDSLNELGLDKDQRWKHLIERIEAIEQILKDLGSFKPWTPGAQPAPESLKYKGVRRRVSPGRVLQFRPELVGGACTFSVEGVLPEGLELNEATGELNGKITTPTPDVKFEIVAKNAQGEVRTPVEFSVVEPPPKGLKYPSLGGMLVVGSQSVFQPEFETGCGRKYKVEPPLPEGLALEEKTGVINGAPTAPVPPQDYVITATNAGGESSVTVNFGAQVPAPVDLSYPTLPDELPVGHSVHFEPELHDGIPTEFKVSPALPDGLILDKTTGTIRGAPTTPTDLNSYTVTAKNDGGQTGCSLIFAVKSSAPASMEYPDLQPSYTNATMVRLEPVVKGGRPDSYSVEPELPAGLVLSPVTGAITGVPTALCEPTKFTVTAKNAEGSCTADLTFGVTRAPPSSLSYPSLQPLYPAGRLIVLQPSVDGEVDSYEVTPALPDGLTLDEKTGAISGAPTGASPLVEYEVTGRNDVGSTSVKVPFAVEVLPPTKLAYPSADDTYHVGESVHWVPEVEGGGKSFSVEPALPAGLSLDPSTGVVSGSAEEAIDMKEYTFTVSNEGGSTSTAIEFMVEYGAPTSLTYPSFGSELVIGEAVEAGPEIQPGRYKYEVTPALPDGLALDPKTGFISGSPLSATPNNTYTVTASNSAGSIKSELTFAVTNPMEETVIIDSKFAEVLEEITDCAELLEKAPPKELRFGDWMIWMVHRVFLDDPTLVELNFNHCKMPLPHEEWRVAPKLMKALATNTHVESLLLAQSNLQKPQGHELAEALKMNTTLRVMNIESNYLDSDCMRHIAEALAQAPQTAIEQLRLSFQVGMAKYYGRPVEEAFGEMMKQNKTITRLGLDFDDRHWMNAVNGYLTRNADRARKLRKRRVTARSFSDALPVEERTLSRLHLLEPPPLPASQMLSAENPHAAVFNKYVAENKMVPSAQQLQSFARGAGTSLKFSELKPTIESCRSQLLSAAGGTQVKVVDSFNAESEGALEKAEAQGSRWLVEVVQEDKKLRCTAADREPGIAISPEWAAWIAPEK